MNKVYGKLRQEDLPTIEALVSLFRQHNLFSGLHGTSLWNPNYKDVDLLVVSLTNDVAAFKLALQAMLVAQKGEIVEEKGDDVMGLDYDIRIGSMVLHLSFVILL